MNIKRFVSTAQKLAVDNAPTILTGLGIAGTIGTAFLTGKAAYESYERLHDAHELKRVTTKDTYAQLTKKEMVGAVWQLYVPAVGVGCATVGCIFFANRISTKRIAALASAYAITDKAYTEYQEKVKDTFGKQKEEKVRADVAQDRINAAPASDSDYHKGTGGAVRVQDAWSKRYFWSDMETIKKAQNDLNHQVLGHGYATLADFYSQLCLEPTKEAYDMGWNSDKLLEVTFTSGIDDQQRPILVMDFAVAPVRNFFRTH